MLSRELYRLAPLTGKVIMNSGLNWLPQYSVGHDLLDRQHQVLLNSGKHLHLLLDQKSSLQDFELVIAEALEIFLGTLKVHFKDEEAIMLESGYPDFNRHKECHRDCIEFFNLLLDDTGSLAARANHIQTHITHWVIHHVVHEDSKYVSHLK